jgi:hypothetical protein
LPPACEHPDQAEAGTHLPHAAAAFAGVHRAQTHKLVGRRFELHRSQQFLTGAVPLLAGGEGRLHLGQPGNQRIPLALQLAEAKQARLGCADRTRPEGVGAARHVGGTAYRSRRPGAPDWMAHRLCRDVGKAIGDKLRKRPLQPCDLRAQGPLGGMRGAVRRLCDPGPPLIRGGGRI